MLTNDDVITFDDIEKLKSCPCCNGKPIVDYYDYNSYYDCYNYCVYCMDCDYKDGTVWDTKDDAMQAWNTYVALK